MIIKGKVLDVEHVDVSKNGNARKRVFVLTDDCQLISAYTKVDSCIVDNLNSAIGKTVEIKTKMIRNKLVIQTMTIIDRENISQYIDANFARLGIAEGEIQATMKIAGPEGKTNYISLTAGQLAQIKFILK